MSRIGDSRNKLRDIEGFIAVGVFTPNGELAEIGSLPTMSC